MSDHINVESLEDEAQRDSRYNPVFKNYRWKVILLSQNVINWAMIEGKNKKNKDV